MSKSAFILAPTSLATQLSALTSRPVVVKSIPAMAKDGKPIDPARAAKVSLAAAVARFNAAA